MNELNDWGPEERLKEALGTPGEADFETWKLGHGDDVAHLNPVVTRLTQRKRRRLMRATSATLAAALILAVLSPVWMTEKSSFAETVETIDQAKSVTWTLTSYTRMYSKDGQRTWLSNRRSEYAYLAPSLYRNTRYDDDGRVRSVEIQDVATKRTLHLDMRAKKATWRSPKSRPANQYGPGGPFDWLKDFLQRKPLQLVGQRQVDGVPVNVFRHHREKRIATSGKGFDVWLDAKTKQLVGLADPSADYFDPETSPDRDNPAEEKFSKGEIAGSVQHEIVFDAELDPELFDLTPPAGFEVVHESPPPPMTENDLIEWLRVTARFNGGRFVDTPFGVDRDKHNEAGQKKKADRTEVEQAFLDLWLKHLTHRSYPIWSFADDNAVPKTFRYLGKGVTLGDADRFVCWYKSKDTGKYRAVYGDLSVKDVSPDELPLPVEE